MNGHELTLRAAVEMARHKKRFPRTDDSDRRYRCRCGNWIGTPSEWNRHVAASVLAAAGADLAGELSRTAPEVPDGSTPLPVLEARRSAYIAAAGRARDLLAGCICRPGLIGSWGCEVEGHDTGDGDYE